MYANAAYRSYHIENQTDNIGSVNRIYKTLQDKLSVLRTIERVRELCSKMFRYKRNSVKLFNDEVQPCPSLLPMASQPCRGCINEV